jgi:hypothetical protein|tara:strand:+ start:4716 stop:4991 length:276 start_codon:yes stop_codon:yes gene_type:complete
MKQFIGKEFEAVGELIFHEIEDDKFSIRDEGDYFHVTFENERFNDIDIKVIEVDEEELKYSTFSINTYDDTYEEFDIYSYTIKEFWRTLLW